MFKKGAIFYDAEVGAVVVIDKIIFKKGKVLITWKNENGNRITQSDNRNKLIQSLVQDLDNNTLIYLGD